VPFSTRTRSPLRKEGAQSWVTTRVLPSSMRKVTRYTLLAPAAVLPLVPELPTEPLLPLLVELPLRGTTSIRVTTLLGVPAVDAVELLELVSCGLLVLWPAPVMPLVLLPMLLAPLISLPVDAVLLPAPMLLILAVPLEGVLCAASPLVEALGVLLAVSLLVLPVELHAASPSASKPANSTLCSLRFMINSFEWGFFQCVRDDAACHPGMTCTSPSEFG
jgi:hypothetical protein